MSITKRQTLHACAQVRHRQEPAPGDRQRDGGQELEGESALPETSGGGENSADDGGSGCTTVRLCSCP